MVPVEMRDKHLTIRELAMQHAQRARPAFSSYVHLHRASHAMVLAGARRSVHRRSGPQLEDGVLIMPCARLAGGQNSQRRGRSQPSGVACGRKSDAERALEEGEAAHLLKRVLWEEKAAEVALE
jgi:hypothetical protein